MNCVLHKSLKLEYFCQTCLDPICSECIKSNPHSNEFHKIQSIEQAVQKRRKRFQLYIINEINPLRQKMIQKLEQLKQIESSQTKVKNVILKDIMLQFEAIQQRTKQTAQQKITQYQTQIKYYQAYLNMLDDLAYTFEKTWKDPYNFLILYQDLNNQLKKLQSKQIIEKISLFQIKEPEQSQLVQTKKFSINPSQFSIPRQIKTIFKKLQTLPQLNSRNQFINNLIAEASQNYKDQQKKVKSDGVKNLKNILHLYNDTNQKITFLNSCKTCIFCEASLTLDNLNDQCQQNKSIKVEISKNYLHVKIQPQFKGTRRHYWTDSNGSNRKLPDINAHVLIRVNMKKQFYNSLKDLSIVKCCFKKYQIDNQKNFIQPFKKQDKQNKGLLSKISFKYILTKTFQMRELYSDLLTELFSYNWIVPQDKQQEIKQEQSKLSDKSSIIFHKIQPIQGVNYILLPYFIQNPLFPYEQFVKIEEQIQKTKPIAPQSVDLRRYKW